MQHRIFIAILMFKFTIEGSVAITKDQVKEIKKDIVELIEANRDPKDGALHFIPGFVRVAFHDCVGGCDGCLNHSDENNAGLSVYVGPLETIYLKYKTLLSRADFWQLAGITAIERSVEKCKDCIKPDLPFETGRKDCKDSPNYTGDPRSFPMNAGHGDINNALTFMEEAFGLPRNEPELATALIGAHTLGEAHREHSGWEGIWTETPDQLSNRYYKSLVKQKWSQINLNQGDPRKDPVWQWQPGKKLTTTKARYLKKRKEKIMMLNTDMAFAKKLSPDATGEAICKVSSKCKAQPETAEWVLKYANDAKLWEKNFAIAYMRMIRTGYKDGDLTLVK
ncbi:unnamed protein product [Owenia fusiformis]|uniref:Uncharacterized protein n=1 Tax=Owenia fusiformis TaxID=6347 RepID=A0A8J1TYL0_OWEFU|nr:unnamed protein product [Owenia fusiformis]